jgi:hypothetical protein
MNKQEEEIQKKIDAGLKPVGEELDVRAYEEVFLRLRRRPETLLSTNFADKIIARVIEKNRHSASRDFVWFGLGIFALVIACVVAVVMTGFQFKLGFLKDISSYFGLFAFGIVFILVLNRLDKKLVLRKSEYDQI